MNVAVPASPLVAQGGNLGDSDPGFDSGEDGLTLLNNSRGSTRELLSRDSQIDISHNPIIVQLQNLKGDRRELRPPTPYLEKNLKAFRTFQRKCTN